VAELTGPERPTPVSRLTSRSTTFALLLLGGLAAVVSTAQPWWRAEGGGAKVAFTGTEATGGLSQALAVVCLAGSLLVLVLRVRGRRVLAVLLALAGLGVLLVGALRRRPTGDAVRTKLAEVSLINQYAVSPTLWPWVFAAAGAVLTAGAVALLVGAPSWAATAGRFDRRAAVDPLATAVDDPAGIWKAQDAGLDPTAGPDEQPPVAACDPDVQIDDPGDTMVANSTDRPRPARSDLGRDVAADRSPNRRSTPSQE
jgi:uncharacterized membrane protein (TIGR02234 family)